MQFLLVRDAKENYQKPSATQLFLYFIDMQMKIVVPLIIS